MLNEQLPLRETESGAHGHGGVVAGEDVEVGQEGWLVGDEKLASWLVGIP